MFFQSTPPRGGRPRQWKRCCITTTFNPRPREGGDLSWDATRSFPTIFQSTPPRGGRPARVRRRMLTHTTFNPRPREGGDDTMPEIKDVTISFNPRPREGGDHSGGGISGDIPLSIHAPARGATSGYDRNGKFVIFQSTPPRGGRRRGALPQRIRLFLSIHAPARGATARNIISARNTRFQSTPPRGGRPYALR